MDISTTVSQPTSILQHFQRAFSWSYELLPPRGAPTLHQEALFILWVSVTVYLVYQYLGKHISSKNSSGSNDTRDSPISTEPSFESRSDDAEGSLTNDRNSNPGKDLPSGRTPIHKQQQTDTVIIVNNNKGSNDTHVCTVPFMKALLAAFTIGWIMMYYFLCDYVHFFPKADRTYSRDLFVFLSILLLVAAAAFTSTEVDNGKLLNRHQTEEWKGWMQIMFVWYHYFKAAETYNAVRIYIGAYVWMTGFGNFSFFWVRRDYSIRRVLKMLFRLNFLVVLTTMVTNNQYMLYYICAMHTFWFLSVYAMMRPFEAWNESRRVMIMKFCIYFIVVFLLFDIQGVAELAFKPLTPVLSFQNSLHEWIFRSGLDHYGTFVGMLCAYNHPNAERLLTYINGHRRRRVFLLCGAIVSTVTLYTWYQLVFIKSKYDYNRLHPYTSPIPILIYIVVRNGTPWLRRRYLAMFAVLGKITLETYISQLHIYLQADAKMLLVYIPDYPLLNFLLNTFIYLYLSHLLFEATVTINEYIFARDTGVMCRNIFGIATWLAACYLAAITFRQIP